MLCAHFCIRWWVATPTVRWLEVWVGPWKVSCYPWASQDSWDRWCVVTSVRVRLIEEKLPQTRKPPSRAGREMPLARLGVWMRRHYSLRPWTMIQAYHLRWPDGRVENRF